MKVTCVHIQVKQEHIEAFIAATTRNHEGSIQEQGNIRFDVLQHAEDPGRFLLYEVFESEEAVAFHRTTPHYQAWRETVADWMEKPREGVPYKILHPQDRSRW